jgi:hypothetical protein
MAQLLNPIKLHDRAAMGFESDMLRVTRRRMQALLGPLR